MIYHISGEYYKVYWAFVNFVWICPIISEDCQINKGAVIMNIQFKHHLYSRIKKVSVASAFQIGLPLFAATEEEEISLAFVWNRR